MLRPAKGIASSVIIEKTLNNREHADTISTLLASCRETARTIDVLVCTRLPRHVLGTGCAVKQVTAHQPPRRMRTWKQRAIGACLACWLLLALQASTALAQDGRPNVVAPDIGAFEVQPEAYAPSTGDARIVGPITSVYAIRQTLGVVEESSQRESLIIPAAIAAAASAAVFNGIGPHKSSRTPVSQSAADLGPSVVVSNGGKVNIVERPLPTGLAYAGVTRQSLPSGVGVGKIVVDSANGDVELRLPVSWSQRWEHPLAAVTVTAGVLPFKVEEIGWRVKEHNPFSAGVVQANVQLGPPELYLDATATAAFFPLGERPDGGMRVHERVDVSATFTPKSKLNLGPNVRLELAGPTADVNQTRHQWLDRYFAWWLHIGQNPMVALGVEAKPVDVGDGLDVRGEIKLNYRF